MKAKNLQSYLSDEMHYATSNDMRNAYWQGYADALSRISNWATKQFKRDRAARIRKLIRELKDQGVDVKWEM